MAEVIDLISSSPSSPRFTRVPPPLDKGKSVESTTRLDGVATRIAKEGTTSHPVSGNSTSVDVLILSDDFDSTIDIDEPILHDTNGNKRRRLSPPEKDAIRPFKRSISGPARQSVEPNTRTSSNRTSLLDPIEFSSSPELSILNQAESSKTTSRIQAPSRTNNLDGNVVYPGDEPDPFASSPQVVAPLVGEQAARVIPESSDPFASSPPPVAKIPSVPQVETGPTISHTLDRRKVSPKRKNWDPISSSAPDAGSFDSPRPKSSKQSIVIDDDSNSEEGSGEEFPDIADFDIAKCKVRSFRRTQSETITSKSRTKSSKPVPKKSEEEKTREKEAKAAAKEIEKENKRQEREKAKEAKLREKERAAALAEVNKLRTDKKVSTPEMMVDIPSSLNATITTQLEAILEGLDVQFTTWESPVENVIKWRRKVRSRFNDDLGLWEPIPLRIMDEKHALVTMTADEFVSLAVDEQLESHIGKMEEHFSGHHIIYLLEGVIPWMRKNRNIRNRQFTSGVRSQEPSATNRRRRNNATEGYVPEETIEDALLQLQIMHDVLIHHTVTPLETAQWIAIFTQHVSTIPYRKQRDHATLAAGFCMDSGQVKTGDDVKDTYVRMLQEIVRVTAPIAYGIASEFGTVTDLVNGLENGGPTTLDAVRKSANKDGAFSDRTVGQAVSRRMHKVFTGRDESSTDV